MFKYTIELTYPLDDPSPDGSEKGFLVVGRPESDPSFQIGDEFWLHWGAGNKFLVKVVERETEVYAPFSSNGLPILEAGEVRIRILVETADKDSLAALLVYRKIPALQKLL